MTSYRVILKLNFYEKLNWGSAFYSVVADPIIFSTTIKLFDNNIVTAWQQLLKINWGVRKLLEKIGVRQGSAGSAGIRRGPQNNWTRKTLQFESLKNNNFNYQKKKTPLANFIKEYELLFMAFYIGHSVLPNYIGPFYKTWDWCHQSNTYFNPWPIGLFITFWRFSLEFSLCS